MKINAILIFDIGKTNKKAILFDENLSIIKEETVQFTEIQDDDGFLCEDIVSLEQWIDQVLLNILNQNVYNLLGVNFSTYGATLVYLDSKNRRLGPLYNYLKPMPEGIAEQVYKNYGGILEFSRITASPALGMLNSGLQIFWLKKVKPEIFSKVKNIVHFPQYLSFRYTGKIVSEYTSIGCHTCMWDFDLMQYHRWLGDESIKLPDPVQNSLTLEGKINSSSLKTGVGIHDSSASLVPYLKSSSHEFILLSTGTWCINMNPFNHTPLTAEQLENDCLCYLSVKQKPVKSSRIFAGNIHDKNVELFSKFFNIPFNNYKKIKPDYKFLQKYLNTDIQEILSSSESSVDLSLDPSNFENFEEAYHVLMVELTKMIIRSVYLILPENDSVSSVYISGGFAKNELFTGLLATYLKDKNIFITEIDNATSLGAAIVMMEGLGLKSWSFKSPEFRKVKPLKRH